MRKKDFIKVTFNCAPWVWDELDQMVEESNDFSVNRSVLINRFLEEAINKEKKRIARRKNDNKKN